MKHKGVRKMNENYKIITSYEQDPDFTKVTPDELRHLEAAENSGFISDDEIDWDNLEQYAE